MNKRDIIIEEARKLFNSYGYKKVSMDELAKQANVTKKTIYSYFKDKEELFKYFIEEELLDIKNKIEKQKKKGSFIDNLFNSIIVMLKVRKESGIVRNLIKDKNDLQNISFLKLYDDDIIKYIKDVLKEEINKGNIIECDVDLTSFIIYKVFVTVLFEYGEEINEEKVAKEITSILKNGLIK